MRQAASLLCLWVFSVGCASVIPPSEAPKAAPVPVFAPDLLSLVPLDGPFPSFAAWCAQAPDRRCQQLPEPPGGAAAIFAVDQPDPVVVVGVLASTGWYVGTAPGSSAPGSAGLAVAHEQRRPEGGPPIVLFRYQLDVAASARAEIQIQAECLLVCVAGDKPACGKSSIPLRARGTSDGKAPFALHADVSIGDITYRAGKLAFALRADKRLVAGSMPEAVEWRRRLSLLAGPHLLPLP